MRDPRLLVVDDERAFCTYIARVAEGEGYEASWTTDALRVIDELRARIFDVIVLDLRMPGLNGIDFLCVLARMGSAARVLLASGVDTKVLETAQLIGEDLGLAMAGLIEKPIRATDLRARLADLRPRRTRVSAAALECAIRRDQLVLHYQPVVSMATGRVMRVEALVRWQHPELGNLPPSEFIPLAEPTALIHGLTTWVARAAMRQCAAWQSEGIELPVAINVSARNMFDEDLPERLFRLSQDAGVEPDNVTVELTETAAARELDRLAFAMGRLRDKGFCLAIDDFGTGYASLEQLLVIPFEEVKIDRRFIVSARDSATSAIVLEHMVRLAHALEMEVTAEGIEDEQLLERAGAAGCDHVQGFFLSRPVQQPRVIETLFGLEERMRSRAELR